ncbi:MAG TPA: AarF/UbiB family protein [Paenirhodobacter sp.]
MNMVLVVRMFHVDPYPGNLFALAGNRVAFIDFGMVGRLTKVRQREPTSLLRAIAGKDAAGLSRMLLASGDDGAVRKNRIEFDTARLSRGMPGQDSICRVPWAISWIWCAMQALLSLPTDLVLLL